MPGTSESLSTVTEVCLCVYVAQPACCTQSSALRLAGRFVCSNQRLPCGFSSHTSTQDDVLHRPKGPGMHSSSQPQSTTTHLPF